MPCTDEGKERVNLVYVGNLNEALAAWIRGEAIL